MTTTEAAHVLDRFHVRQRFARGGMGDTWLADDDETGTRAVLKTVRDDLVSDETALRCMHNEIDVTARLCHAHAVRHLAHGVWGDRNVLALGLIPGASVCDALASAGAFPWAAAAAVALDIADALAHVHSVCGDDGCALDFVHGDVTPSNIMLDHVGGAHLVDFGSASGRSLDSHGSCVVAKPGYVSPERITGHDIDGRADQFALGVCLWEMLAARRLHNGSVSARTPVPSLATIVVLPATLEGIVVRMLAEERCARFVNMTDVAAALRALLDSTLEGAPAARTWLAVRASRSSRRTPGFRRGGPASGGDSPTAPLR